jgi:hypothetical protein|eukprot:TRINITY_DN13038_c0_g1_i1.p1 TRINITY_DN13038_c0_g1~~TRINITY_DN13038_c0_g1_i1.p1  ORF type:complete len:118 (-),score=22.75 TRINITY_DN13038_c0_g1_i1:82-435(-)
MSKKKSIISYDKLNIDQKKQLLIAFPEGFSGNTTKMTNPITGEVFDSLLWETEEVIYLVKLPKVTVKSPSVDDDDDDFEDDFDSVDAKGDDDDVADDDDDDDSYDDAPEDDGEDDED